MPRLKTGCVENVSYELAETTDDWALSLEDPLGVWTFWEGDGLMDAFLLVMLIDLHKQRSQRIISRN